MRPASRITAAALGIAAWAALAAGTARAADGPPATGPGPGVYESAGCERMPGPGGAPQAVRRQLTLGATGSAWQFTVFADDACTQPLLRVRGRTEAQVLGPARGLPGAVAVRVRFLDRLAVAYTDDGAASLSHGGCGSEPWRAGVEQPIGQSRCLGMPPIEACPFDHDVLRVEGDTLYTGRRDGDGTLCTPDRQPTALDPRPLRRR